MPERLESEVLHKVRYINTLTFTYLYLIFLWNWTTFHLRELSLNSVLTYLLLRLLCT